MAFIAPIVEGHGEIEAVPLLLRRIAQRFFESYPQINPPYRVHASSFVKFDAEFVKAISITAAKAKAQNGLVLILLDCEDDCAAEVGPRILAEASKTRGDVPYLVCLAVREYETWLLHGAASLAGVEGLPKSLTTPENPEAMRDAKGWLRDHMGRKYIEREHQEAFTAVIDLEQMTESPSFRRLVERLRPFFQTA